MVWFLFNACRTTLSSTCMTIWALISPHTSGMLALRLQPFEALSGMSKSLLNPVSKWCNMTISSHLLEHESILNGTLCKIWVSKLVSVINSMIFDPSHLCRFRLDDISVSIFTKAVASSDLTSWCSVALVKVVLSKYHLIAFIFQLVAQFSLRTFPSSQVGYRGFWWNWLSLIK